MTEFLTISSADLRVGISPYGAALARVWVRGHANSLVLGLPTPQDYAHAPHAIGVIVGPVAGRVSQARTRIAGTTYQMEQNAPPHCLHSGSKGVQHRLWKVEDHTALSVTLRCELADGDCGLPGNRVMRAQYSVSGLDLTLKIETTSDADTIANAASHAYWVLDDTGSLRDHRLQVAARQMCQTGDDMVPTGATMDVSETEFDYQHPRSPVGGAPLDACFCLEPQHGDILQTAMMLTSSDTNLGLKVATNQPGLVLYSAQGMPSLTNLARTPKIGPFSGLAIEAQSWPDSNNNTSFPSILLKPETILKQITCFSVVLP